jgi:hypothetical protein
MIISPLWIAANWSFGTDQEPESNAAKAIVAPKAVAAAAGARIGPMIGIPATAEYAPAAA